MMFYKKKREQFSASEEQNDQLIDAFSLAEILIVLAIMGILIMLVVPNNAGIAARAKSMEAKQELKFVNSLQYGYFLQYSKYSGDLGEIDYVPHKTVLQNGTANYEISILEANPTGYKAQAKAVQDFNGNGTYNLWEIDQEGNLKEIQKD